MTSLSKLSSKAAAFLTVLFLAAPVTAEDVTPANSDQAKKNAAVQTLYQNSGMSDRVRKMSAGMIDQMEAGMIKEGIARSMGEGKTQAEAEKFVTEGVKPVMDKLRKEYPPEAISADMGTAIISGLEKSFTTEEINALAKVYSSPVYQRYLQFNEASEKTTSAVLANQLEAYLKALQEEARGGKPAGPFQVGAEPPETKAVSPQKKELIRKMFRTSGAPDIMKDLLIKAEEFINEKLQADPKLPADEKEKKLAQNRKYIELLKTRLNFAETFDPYVIADADKTLSEDDLKTLIEFNEDPVKQSANKKFAGAMVNIIQSSTQIVVAKVLASIYSSMPAQPKKAAE